VCLLKTQDSQEFNQNGLGTHGFGTLGLPPDLTYSLTVNPWQNWSVPPSSLVTVLHHLWRFGGMCIGKTSSLFPTGGRTVVPSGRIRQNLSFTTTSFDWTSWTLLTSVCVRGRSISRVLTVFHIEIHRNLHSGVDRRASSPSIRRQYWWWESMWDTERSYMCHGYVRGLVWGGLLPLWICPPTTGGSHTGRTCPILSVS
jgi:hypothetical protein